MWVSSGEQKWSTFGERRRAAADQGYAKAKHLLDGPQTDGVVTGQVNGQEQFNLAVEYSKRAEAESRNYGAADIERVRAWAEQGDIQAQHQLGKRYLNGWDVSASLTDAVRWFRAAAEQGFSAAQTDLARLYEGGRGVPRDQVEAIRLYRAAAAQGDPAAQQALKLAADQEQAEAKAKLTTQARHQSAAEPSDAAAQFRRGVQYTTGDGVPRDSREAVRWFRAAAEQGHATAQFLLGRALVKGDGVARDQAEAARWYRKAAEQGDPGGQVSLAIAYNRGEGVPKDPAEGVRWLRRAAEQGDAGAMWLLGSAYKWGDGVAQGGSVAADWYYQAGVTYLSKGQRERALECADAIRKLPETVHYQVSNIGLADVLVKAIYSAASEPPQPATPSPNQANNVSTGTCWVVAPSHVITNFHVVEGHSTFTLIFPDGTKANAEVVVADRANDLVLLRTSGQVLPPPLLLAADDPGAGTKVFTIGYPHPDLMGIEPKVTDGIISSAAGLRDDVRVFQISVPVQGGNSGGPLLNMKGEVVGVVVSKLNAAQVLKWTGDLPENVNYAIKGSYLRALLEAGRAGGTTASASRVSDRRLLAALGQPVATDLAALAERITKSVAVVIAE